MDGGLIYGYMGTCMGTQGIHNGRTATALQGHIYSGDWSATPTSPCLLRQGDAIVLMCRSGMRVSGVAAVERIGQAWKLTRARAM